MTEIFDVICIGAALVDMIAQVERHPEDDDEVFVSDLKIFSGGAAANTAYACAKLGLQTVFIGKLGKNDTMGTKIIKDFNEALNIAEEIDEAARLLIFANGKPKFISKENVAKIKALGENQ